MYAAVNLTVKNPLSGHTIRRFGGIAQGKRTGHLTYTEEFKPEPDCSKIDSCLNDSVLFTTVGTLVFDKGGCFKWKKRIL